MTSVGCIGSRLVRWLSIHAVVAELHLRLLAIKLPLL
jgi:hypothetical protein